MCQLQLVAYVGMPKLCVLEYYLQVHQRPWDVVLPPVALSASEQKGETQLLACLFAVQKPSELVGSVASMIACVAVLWLPPLHCWQTPSELVDACPPHSL